MINTQPNVPSHNPTRSNAESKAEMTDRIFREILEKEEARQRRKTARLRAARLEKQAEDC